MEDYSIDISVKIKNSNIPNDLAEIVNFHFSHYKSMGTISCHSNQSSYPTRIKSTIYVEANVLSMYAKFRLHPPYGFKEDFYENLPFLPPRQPVKFTDFDKSRKKRRGLLNKHFCKKKIQISPMRQKKLSISSFSHYKSMGTISCNSNQSSYPTGTKNTIIRSPDL